MFISFAIIMEREPSFVATSPILAKILKNSQENVSPEKSNSEVTSQDLPVVKALHSPVSSPERSQQSFNMEEFFDKLQSSPRRSDASQTGEGNHSIDNSDTKQNQIGEKEAKEGKTLDSQSFGVGDRDAHKIVDRKEKQGAEGSKMAWKADLHGFYQSSRDFGFFNRFCDPEEQELSAENQEKLISIGDYKLHGDNGSGKLSCIEVHDNSELFNDDVDVRDVNQSYLKRGIPLVIVQAPTPSDLSRASSSIGSSRPETPEPNLRHEAGHVSNNEPRLGSTERDGILADEVKNQKDVTKELDGVEIGGEYQNEGTDEEIDMEVDDVKSHENLITKDNSKDDEELTENAHEMDFQDNITEKEDDNDVSGTAPIAEEVEDVNTEAVFGKDTVNETEAQNDSASSFEQGNSSLLTSWTEQEMISEISSANPSDTVTFVRKIDSSPTVTWGTITSVDRVDASKDCDDDEHNNILQTSIGSATDLREILERSLQQELNGCDIDDENGKDEERTRGFIEPADRKDFENADYVETNDVIGNIEDLGENETVCAENEKHDINQYENGFSKEESSENSSFGTEMNSDTFFDVEHSNDDVQTWQQRDYKRRYKLNEYLKDEMDDCLENLEALSLLKSLEIEKVKLETIENMRRKMEDICNGIPIDKISSFAYEKWQDLMHLFAKEEQARFEEFEEKYDEVLNGMKSELEKVKAENLELSNIVGSSSRFKVENELLKKQVEGLEEFVSSLERRMGGRMKENAILIEELDEWKNKFAEKEEAMKDAMKNHENKLKEAKMEIDELKEHKMKFENEIKIKDIENRRILNEKEKLKDEAQLDFEKLNSNSSILRNKITEIQNENEALKTATEADQTIIKHLESKLQTANNLLDDVRSEKSKLLVELQDSRMREAELKQGQDMAAKERNAIEKEKEGFYVKLRKLQEEKNLIEKQLNEKVTSDMKNAEAMLKEIKNLESSLNSVRNEKSLVEDKYSNLKFELERMEMIKERKTNHLSSSISTSERKNETRESELALIDLETETDDHLGNIRKSSDSGLVFNGSLLSRSSHSIDPNQSFEPRSKDVLSYDRSTDSRILSDKHRSPLRHYSPNPTHTPLFTIDDSSHGPSKARLSDDIRSSEALHRKLDRQFSLDTNRTSQVNRNEKSNILQDSDTESIDSYADFPRISSSIPTVVVVRTDSSPARKSDISSVLSPKRRYKETETLTESTETTLVDSKIETRLEVSPHSRQRHRHENGETNSRTNVYSAEDTRLWLRSMETKLEQTDQILKAMKKSKHISV